MTSGVASGDCYRAYVENHFLLVQYPHRQKGPRADGWTDPSRAKRSEAEIDPNQNVGVLLGTEIAPGRFLADVDFDWANGVRPLGRLLRPTSFVFGRRSKDISHAFYTTPNPVASRKFEDLDGQCLVELRAAKKDGSIGFQTMLPPSVHPNGEEIEMRLVGDITHDPELEQRVVSYAIGCLLLKHLPRKDNEKGEITHDPRMDLAGLLLKDCRLPETVVAALLRMLTEATGNDAADAERAVHSTAQKIRARQRVTGKAAVAKLLGDRGKDIVARIIEWARGSVVGANDIVMAGGDLADIVDRAEQALLASDVPIYQRGGTLVRPVRIDAKTSDAGVRREHGSTVLVPVREAWLLEQMGRVVNWFRPAKSGEHVRADPDQLYARTLLARGEWKFPVLRAVVSCPTLAPDGRPIETAGYDADTGIYLDFQPGTFPAVPASPTQSDARLALEQLAHPLRAFPFADDASRSVALSALLTAPVRPSLRTAPLHGYDAPVAGSGKSLAAEMSGLLASGVRPPALSQGKTPEEDEKRLSTVLHAGDPVIHIDNCDRALSGDFLCSMLTQQTVQARILGQSERRVFPTTALVIATGNNLTFAGDVCRRVVVCRLDAGVERPDTREFDFDCHAEVLADRHALVIAALTVLRAYALAGRPVKLQRMGSFADWEWIRGALVWLGCADPADTRQAILDADPRKDELLTIMQVWEEALWDEPIEVGQIPNRSEDLKRALADLTLRGIWNTKSVGWWLKRHMDRVVGGRCFRATPGRNGHVWRLAVVASPEQQTFPDVSGELPGWLASGAERQD